MDSNIRTIPTPWVRLATSIILAFVLVAVVLFGPAILGLPVSAQPGKQPLLSIQPGLVQAAGEITITKTANPPDSVDQGGFITYTLIVTNLGAGALNSVFVEDTVPQNTSCVQIFPGIDSSGGDWSAQGDCSDGNAQWTYLNLNGTNPGGAFSTTESVRLRYRVAVTEPLRNQVDKIINEPGYNVAGTNDLSQPPTITAAGAIAVENIINAPEWLLTKTATPTPTVEPGSRLTYTIFVTNVGNLTTEGLYTITDVVPDNTTYVPGSAAPAATFNSASLTWSSATPLGIGQGISLTYVVTVTNFLTDGIKIVNRTYAVTGGNVFSQANGAPITVTVDTPVTLTVAKSDLPYDPVQAGDLLTYTITITNETSSKGAALGLIFTDTVPTNTLFVDAGFVAPTAGITTFDGMLVTWQVITPAFVAIGDTVDLTFTVRVQSPLTNGAVLTNSLYGVSVTNTLNTAPAAPVTTTVQSAPQITMTKTVTPQEVLPGKRVTYTIVVTNSGNETALNLPFTDTIQAPDFVQSATNWNLTVTGTNLTGQVGVVTYTLVATAGNTPGQFPNFVTTTVTSPVTIGPVATVTVRGPVDFQISKARVGSSPVVARQRVTYTLSITNAPGSETADAIVTDTFTNADLLTYTINSIAFPGAGCSGSGPLVCNVPNFTGSTVITVVLDSSGSISGVITNTATITPVLIGLGDLITTNNRSSITTPVRYPEADLQISKRRVGNADLVTGDQITYTLTISNTPGSDAVDVVIADIFTNATYASDSSPDCSLTGSQQVGCTIANFTNTQVITLVFNTANSISGTITNTAKITFSNKITAVELDDLDNSATITTPVRYPEADLQISKRRVGAAELVTGDQVTYTLTITNTPGSDPVDVSVTDIFTNMNYASDSSPDCSLDNPQQIGCAINNFSSTQVITLVFNTASSISGTITNTAKITFSSEITAVELDDLDNSTIITTPIRYPEANLQLNKTRLGSGTVIAGQTITYSIVVTNAPGSDLVDAVVTDTFDLAEAAFGSCLPASQCANLGGGVVTWTLQAFTNTQYLTLTLDTLASFSGTLTNTARISAAAASAIELFIADNSDDVATLVRFPKADLQISKTRLGSGTVIAGQTITYTLSITNAGSETVDAVVTDTYTGTATVVFSETNTGDTCSTAGNQLVCILSNFTNTGLITLALQTGATFSDTLINSAFITPTAPFAVDPNPDDNRDTVTASVRLLEADLQIQKDGPTTTVAGDTVTYTLTITNAGPDTLDVVVTDTFSTGTLNSVEPSSFCSGSGPVVCNFASFTNTAVITVVLDTPASPIQFTLNNSAEIALVAQNTVDPNQDNNDDAIATTVRPRQANLKIDKQRLGGSPIIAGEQVTFTLTITNAGPDSVAATLNDTATSGSVTGLAVIAPGWLCSGVTASSANCSNNSFELGSQTITVVMTTSNSFTGALQNLATIAVGSPASEIDSFDNTSSDTVEVVSTSAPALIITKRASPNPAVDNTIQPGSTITYRLAVTNNGTASASGVVITDILPGTVGFVAGSGSSNGSFVENSGRITVSQTTLGINQALTATWQVTVTAETSGTVISNQAGVRSSSVAPVASNIVTHRVVTVSVGGPSTIYLPIVIKDCCQPNLTIESFVVNTSFNPPQVTIVIRNDGLATTGEGFWVDFYVNPSTEPENLTGGDRRWQQVSSRGIAWPVGQPLAPGQSAILSSNSGFDPAQTTWTNPLQTGVIYNFFAFVDSFDADGDSFVEILESDETDNQSGPVTRTLAAGAGLSSTDSPPTPLAAPVDRRDLGR